MGVRVHFLARCLTVLALLAALSSVGLAHRLAVHPVAPELAAFLLSGGALEDLCGGQESPSHTDLPVCDACRIVNAAGLPSPPEHCPVVALPCIVLPVRDHRQGAALATLDPSRWVRAPPRA